MNGKPEYDTPSYDHLRQEHMYGLFVNSDPIDWTVKT